jgi:tetrahydromethanopterin S-methyltransferase subunit G
MAGVGVIYDSNEVSRMEKLLDETNTLFEKADNEKQFQNKNILRYAVILGGIAITLVLFKVFIDKKK